MSTRTLTVDICRLHFYYNRGVFFPSHEFGLRAHFPLAPKHLSFALLLNGCRRLGKSVSPILHSIFDFVATSTGPSTDNSRYSFNSAPSSGFCTFVVAPYTLPPPVIPGMRRCNGALTITLDFI